MKSKTLYTLSFLTISCYNHSLAAFENSNCLTVSNYAASIFSTGGQAPVQKEKAGAAVYKSRVLPTDAGGYGYEIYANNKLVIRQQNIPGVSGVKGFKRKSDAEKVAGLVIKKMSKGIMPPTVDKSEMESLKVMF